MIITNKTLRKARMILLLTMILLLVMATSVVVTNAHAGLLQQDDKRVHVAATLMASVVCDGVTDGKHPFSCAGFALSIGILKELRDRRQPNNKFDNDDLKADAIGSVLTLPLFYKEW